MRIRSVIQCLLVCSAIYLITNTIINLWLTSRTKSSSNETSNAEKSENRNKITVIILEFEFFDNDLTETLRSICRLSSVAVLVVSQIPIYPPVKRPNDCDITFFDHSFHLNRTSIDSRIESHINSELVLVVPDSTRIVSEEAVYESIRRLNQLNANERTERTALVIAIGDDQQLKSQCVAINFNVKRWSLQYSRRQSADSCDAFEGNEFAVLAKKSHILRLNSPFIRPFIQSFYIQSKLSAIKVSLFEDLVLRRGRKLFVTDRNRWKHELWTKDRTKKFFSFIGVKKVIDSDGFVHWFGCNKESARCFPTVIDETPDYLWANRWTPVCCIENLAKTGRHVFQVLESHSVRYWLEGGSLLGAARNGQIIPWDYDIDVGVYREDIQKCPYFPTNGSIVDEKGFLWERASEGDFYRVHFSASNRLHVDVFPFESRNGTMTKHFWYASHPQDCEFPESFLRPLTRIRFVEWNAFAPNSVTQFLEYKFGKNVIERAEYPNPELLRFEGN